MFDIYLKKLQELQLKTLDTPVNIEIATKYDEEDHYPWAAITVTTQRWYTETKYNGEYLAIHIYSNMYGSDERNEKHLEIAYEKISRFVEELLKNIDTF